LPSKLSSTPAYSIKDHPAQARRDAGVNVRDVTKTE
jgi:hypothetical protein